MAPAVIEKARTHVATSIALAVVAASCWASTAEASVVSGTVGDPEDVNVQYPFGPPPQWYTDVRSVSAAYDRRAGRLTVTFTLLHPIRAYFEALTHATVVREKDGRTKNPRKSVDLVAKYHADAPVPPDLTVTGRDFAAPLAAALDFPGGVLTFTAQHRRLRNLNLTTVTDVYTDDHGHIDRVAPIALR